MSVSNCRKRAGYSAAEVAEYIGVTIQCVKQWEIGAHRPQKPNEDDLCDLFGVSPEELYAEEKKIVLNLRALKMLYGNTDEEHERFCKAAQVQERTVVRWFRFVCRPKPQTLRRIAEAYGLEVKDFYELQMPR